MDIFNCFLIYVSVIRHIDFLPRYDKFNLIEYSTTFRKDTPMTSTTGKTIIELDNVCFNRQDKAILKNIQWTINQGQHWALLGLNGSGKSSIINMLTGYHFPSSGQVKVLDQLFGVSSIPDLQTRIGIVSAWINQEIPSRLSVLDTIISGKFASLGLYQKVTDSLIQEAEDLLDTFNFTAFRNRRMATLSQGERQTVLILRALMTQPELLILDEPTSGLDLFARESLLAMLDKLAKEKPEVTQLMVTHHTEEIIPFYQKICLLKDGEIFAKGDRSLMLDPDRLHDFYGQPVLLRPFKKGRILVMPK